MWILWSATESSSQVLLIVIIPGLASLKIDLNSSMHGKKLRQLSDTRLKERH